MLVETAACWYAGLVDVLKDQFIAGTGSCDC